MPDKKNGKKDVIEIPVGKYIKKIRSNPWIIYTIILLIAFLVLLVISLNGGGITAQTSGKDAAGKLVSFINAQGRGEASLVDVKEDKGLYKVTLSYQGQNLDVYVTKDGSSLVSDLVPLTGEGSAGRGSPASGERKEVDAGDSPVLGDKLAKITIIEFSDYQCPFCGKFWSETLPEIKKNYIDTGKAKLVYKDFPLSNIHPNAEKAAEAARCVGEQKGDPGYFKMHDKLFENQAELSIDNYKKWAREVGLNGAAFDECLDTGKYADDVKADMNYGSSLGVQGTPGFFINGLEVSGAQPYSAFKQIIDSELEK